MKKNKEVDMLLRFSDTILLAGGDWSQDTGWWLRNNNPFSGWSDPDWLWGNPDWLWSGNPDWLRSNNNWGSGDWNLTRPAWEAEAWAHAPCSVTDRSPSGWVDWGGINIAEQSGVESISIGCSNSVSNPVIVGKVASVGLTEVTAVAVPLGLFAGENWAHVAILPVVNDTTGGDDEAEVDNGENQSNDQQLLVQ